MDPPAEPARQAAQDAQRRVDEERLRIARELHDVVAHTMATITVQAAAATSCCATGPSEAAESLQAIRAASKDGLRELRAILNVLRTASGGDDGRRPDASRRRAWPARCPRRRGAGGRPAGHRDGHRRPARLPAVTDLSAFRIIQEALTNTSATPARPPRR